MTIAEAMAVGLPVVASRVGGIPYMVEHRETGFLFESEDVSEMTGYLEILLTHEELRASMGRRARQAALAQFRPEQIAGATVRVYQNMLANKSAQGQEA